MNSTTTMMMVVVVMMIQFCRINVLTQHPKASYRGNMGTLEKMK
jgi:hypothetical protein